MVKVYIGELLLNVLAFPILNRHLGKEKYTGKKAYRAIFDEMDFSFIELVKNPNEADFFFLPHNYFSVKDKAYAETFANEAKQRNKKALIFAFGDKEEAVDILDAIVFRYAGYKCEGKKDNEVIIPTQVYARDVLDERLFFLRNKEESPTVSFCGWGGHSSFKERVRTFLKYLPFNLKKYFLFEMHADVHKPGTFWRKKGIKALKNSPHVFTSFLIRDFYMANKNTVRGDPSLLRREYIENIQNSDFVLVARGDANMAVRFYEALALGRIPVLLDTEWFLPLEDEIDYKKFVVFVPWRDVKNTDIYIRKFWDSMNNEEFKERQKLARDVFMHYLKLDSFLKYILETKLTHY